MFYWDEDSLYQLVVALFFYFQEVSFNFVIEQPIRQLLVCSSLCFYINDPWVIRIPVLIRDAPTYDCNHYHSSNTISVLLNKDQT